MLQALVEEACQKSQGARDSEQLGTCEERHTPFCPGEGCAFQHLKALVQPEFREAEIAEPPEPTLWQVCTGNVASLFVNKGYG